MKRPFRVIWIDCKSSRSSVDLVMFCFEFRYHFTGIPKVPLEAVIEDVLRIPLELMTVTGYEKGVAGHEVVAKKILSTQDSVPPPSPPI